MESRNRKGSSTPPAARRALSEFTLPDGRRVLVGSPEDAAALRSWYGAREAVAVAGSQQQQQQQQQTRTDDGDDSKAAATAAEATVSPARDDDDDDNSSNRVEVVVHGSDEHRDLLDRTRSHAHARREELRRRHEGAGELLDEWESVSAQLRDVAAQMERLADHGGGKLNATFSKFGYGAHVRTYGDEPGNKEGEDQPASSAASTLSGGTDWGDRRAGGTTMKLFRRPVVKQYFHRGLLWRASRLTEVMSFELFFDLVYVGILHVNGEHLSETPDGAELLRFVVTFCMGWKIWADVAQIVSWFDIDDVAQRVEILFLIACLVGMTTNMISTFHEGHDTFVFLVGFYVAARLFMAAYLVLTAVLVPLVRATMLASAVAIVAPAALWVAATALEMPRRLGLVFVALVLDLVGGGLVMLLYRWSTTAAASGKGRLGVLSRRVAPHFEFYPAINIEHKVERTNAFVSLVFGYSVVAILFQNQGYGLNAFFGKAILGLVQAYIFNWLYFDVDAGNIHVHAIRRSSKHYLIWLMAHLPFIMSYTVATAGLSKLVVASDVANASPKTLTSTYAHRSEAHVPLGIRLFYCVGLGLSLALMGLISFCHEHKLPATRRVPKRLRLANRAVVAAAIAALAAVPEDSLTSLGLVATTTGMVTWVLLVETWGRSCPEETWFGEDGGCKRRYLARCSRRRLEEVVRGEEDGEGYAPDAPGRGDEKRAAAAV
ncbi:hypothetical protein RB595_004729 [Gaeumannomyces hyphopodioides]